MGHASLHTLTQRAFPPSQPDWSSLAQPLHFSSCTEYRFIAEAAQTALRDKIVCFLKKHKIRPLFISSEDFLNFERSPHSIETWLDEYCWYNNLNWRHFDVCVVGPGVKTADASQSKILDREKNNPAYNLDYLRSMIMVLKKAPTENAHLESLCLLHRLTQLLLHDPSTQAYKNYWEAPHKNGIRYFKGAWLVRSAKTHIDRGLALQPILSEIKLELMGQQDLNKLTRFFMGLSRYACRRSRYLRDEMAAAIDNGIDYNGPRTKNRWNNAAAITHLWGVELYKTLHYHLGLNNMLDPIYLDLDMKGTAECQIPMDIRDLQEMIRGEMQSLHPLFKRFLRKKINGSGIFKQIGPPTCLNHILTENHFG